MNTNINDIADTKKFRSHLAGASDAKLRDYVTRFVDLSDDPGHAGFAGVAEAIARAARDELARRASG